MHQYSCNILERCVQDKLVQCRMVNNVEISAINKANIFDRLKLCWGHLDNWTNLDCVQKSKEWLEKANSVFAPTTFIAYTHKVPIGMIEFVPQKFIKKIGICPCRADPEREEMEERYYLGEKFNDYLFISCLFVNQEHQGKGIGKALLTHFINCKTFQKSDGAVVYVTERDEKWDKYIHWPAGPKEFYLKTGFKMCKSLKNPTGYLLCCKKETKTN